MVETKYVELTKEEWEKEGVRLFGEDQMNWKFKCPACGYVASVKDYKNYGANLSMVGFSCIGRMMENPREAFGEEGGGPCNYAGGGLIGLNPVKVIRPSGIPINMMEFAEE